MKMNAATRRGNNSTRHSLRKRRTSVSFNEEKLNWNIYCNERLCKSASGSPSVEGILRWR
jgi:hypothetical protein